MPVRRPGPLCSADRPQGSHPAVGQQEGGPDPAHDVENPGRPLNEDTDPGHTQPNQQKVGQGADGNNQQDVRALDALAEHEGVLGADGDDEGEPAGQA